MKNYLIKYIIFFMVLWFNACGETGSSHITTQSTNSKIEVETENTLIDSTQTKFYMEFTMKSNYETGVISELSDISLDLNTCKIAQINLNTINNKIIFDQPQQTHTIKVTAEFIKPCLPTGYIISAKNRLVYEGTSNEMLYNSGLKPIQINEDITISNDDNSSDNSTDNSNEDDNISTENNNDNSAIQDYDIKFTPIDNSSKIELNSQKRYLLSLISLDNNTTIEDNNINSISISSSDPSKAKLINPNEYSDETIAKSELTFNNSNNIDVYLQTYNSSGIVNLKVTANYINNKNENHDINVTIPITILSGEPTAFSINPAGVKYDIQTKWFEQKFLISASDKYNNIVNTHPIINISAMADFTRDNNGNRILHGSFSNIKGTLIADDDTHIATFESNETNLSNIDSQRDFLFLFGDVTAYEALGKWNIDLYNNTDTTLDLTDSYYGKSQNNLGFAIGHNYYKEICSSESKEWELQIDSTDGSYKLDDEGKAYMSLKFPAYMIGKKIALSVNFSGTQKRSGEVHFETLHSFDGVKTPKTITLEANATATAEAIYFEVNTGTGDRFWVKNAKVVCNTTAENVMVTNFSQNSEVTKIEDCGGTENGEIAYWKFTVSLIDKSKQGSLSFNECQVSSFINGF
ncbi:MAG: hypothetical protein GXO60_06070 [Epsilonproteobacteria bacterium]|nr:hypothetical protein [Campylobacterota bacterium]